MSKKTLIFAVSLALVIILGGVAWVAKEKSEKMALEKVQQEEMAKQVALDADFAKYNKVLARNKVTSVKDLEGPYKKVTVSNGQVTFSFEVPDRWLTETRNSGEVTMNEGELREFLGTNYGEYEGWETDYSGYFRSSLQVMSYKELQDALRGAHTEFNPRFPNATVTLDNKIWYTDIGWDQIHFYILDEKSDASYLSGITYLKSTAEIRENYRIFENNFLKEVERDENGKPMIDKGHTGSFVASIKQKNFVVRIQKEAYVEGEFEEGFRHLIDTLIFE